MTARLRILIPVVTAMVFATAAARDGNPPTDNRLWRTPGGGGPVGMALTRPFDGGRWAAPRVVAADVLPEFSTPPASSRRETAPAVTLPVVVVGQVEPLGSRFVRFTVSKPARVAVDALARRIGSPLDPTLIVRDETRGRDVPNAARDDSPGQAGDVRFALTLEPGTYLVELRDATYRGGPEFKFRLRLGSFPLLDPPVPLAVRRGATTPVSVGGQTVPVVAPADDPAASTAIAPPGSAAWPVPLLISDDEQRAEQEPNDDPKTANELPFPGGVTGRFDRRRDIDCFAVMLKGGARVRIAATTAELLSPADVLLTLRDPAGKEIAASDPRQVATWIDVTPPADGRYVITVEHLTRFHGPEQVYHVGIGPHPGFTLTLPALEAVVPAGGSTKIKVRVDRAGFDGPIALRALGPAGVSGGRELPANAAGDQELTITVAADAPPGLMTLRVVGEGGGRTVRATGRDALKKSLAGMPQPPPDWTELIALAVTPKPPEPPADKKKEK